MNKLWFLWLYILLIALASNEVRNDPVDRTLDFFEKALNDTETTSESEKIVVVGITGVGKTILTHFVGRNHSQMISVKYPQIHDFTIKDPWINETEDGTGDWNKVVPELSVDIDETVWYDFPSLNKRNETYQVAVSLALEKILGNSSSIKVVLAVEFRSILTNDKNFDILLSKTVELVKNATYFEDSLSMVLIGARYNITDNSDEPTSTGFVILSEEDVKAFAAKFLIKRRDELQNKAIASNEEKIQIINALLKNRTEISGIRNTQVKESIKNDSKDNRSDDPYPRISVFWRPAESGPLDKIEKMDKSRQFIRKSVLETISYAPIQKKNISYPLTVSAVIYVQTLISNVTESLWQTVASLDDQLTNGLRESIDSMNDFREKLEAITRGKNLTCSINGPIGIDELVLNFKTLINEFEITSVDTMNFTYIDWYEKYRKAFSDLICVKHKPNYIEFLNGVCTFFKSLENETQANILFEAKATIANISDIFRKNDNQLLIALQHKINSELGFQYKSDFLSPGINSNYPDEDVDSLVDWIERFRSFIRVFNIKLVNMKTFYRIEELGTYFEFLKSIAIPAIDFPIEEIIATSSGTFSYYSLKRRWYSFLSQVYRFLISFEVQKDTSRYNVANLSDWGIPNRPQGLIIDAINFDEFLRKFTNEEFIPEEATLKELNEIIQITLKYLPIGENDQTDTMVIAANFLKSSYIQQRSPRIFQKKITAFVMNTFYVDGDLDLDGFEQFNIFAYTWNFTKAATFNLNGRDISKYKRVPVGTGQPGAHGYPGMNAGNFIGLAKNVTSRGLVMNLNGGNGQNGQDGKGSRKQRKITFNGLPHSNSTAGNCWNETDLLSYYEEYFSGYFAINITSDDYLEDKHMNLTIQLLTPCCGTTGLGGVGGPGGFAGYYCFIRNDENVEVLKNITRIDGAIGKKGEDGVKCKSYAMEVKANITLNKTLDSKDGEICNMTSVFSSKEIVHPKCKDEILNATVVPDQLPQKQANMSVIVEYKRFLLRSVKTAALSNAKTVLETYHFIDRSAEVNANYSIIEFWLEANMLEEQFFHLYDYIDMLPLYDRLSYRIANFIITNFEPLSADEEKMLKLINANTFSKTSSLRNRHTSSLTLHISAYFDKIVYNIRKTKLEGVHIPLNEDFNQYKNGTIKKTNETIKYIEADLQPKIESFCSKLINETQTWIDKITDEGGEQYAKIVARNAIIQSYIDKFAITDGNVDKILAPLELIIAIAEQSVALIGNTSLTNITTKENIKKGVEKFHDKLKKNDLEKLKAMAIELTKLDSLAKEHNISSTLLFRIQKLIYVVNETLKNDTFVHKDVTNSLDDFGDLINDIIIFANNSLPESITALFQKIAETVNVIESSSSLYKLVAKRNETLDAVGKAVSQDKKSLETLREFEDQVYINFLQMLETLYSNITNTKRCKFLKPLNVQQFKVHEILRSLQRNLHGVVAGYKNEDGLNKLLSNIYESINLIIDIYDRIQIYEEKKIPNDYINMEPVPLTAFNETEFNLQANIILAQYYRAVDVFKQAVFPFAANYSNSYQLPQRSDFESVVHEALEGIQTLREYIEEVNSNIDGTNSSIHSAYFGNFGDKEPFYVWKNDENRDQIENLFNGEEIYLLADVKQSHELNAVKFTDIELNFTTHNDKSNDDLNNILDYFDVLLKMMGESNYRCDGNFYTIHSAPLTISYSFAQKRRSFEMVDNPKTSLSPYTLWAMRLQAREGFEDKLKLLKPYINFTDIELHGNGQYVDLSVAICDTNLEKYYSLQNEW